ncbi:MAG TPA: citrate/2-methylcitrate synthase [Caldimonas sp.]|jgi:citrate synthase|nr:citrate/2-methylcitrate synthase [Caldimonas sp.]HEX2542065.1 citrate/2-methylcitrate synthase [Caldimonas sp.]
MAGAPSIDKETTWVSAREAAQILEVSLGTLYTYVSRGLLHPKVDPGAHRKHYSLAEVERLRQRNSGARQAGSVARATLDFGLPVLESALCLIDRGRIYYRGHDVIDLAETACLEEIAALLWGCDVGQLPICTPPLSRRARTALGRTVGSPMPARLPSAYHLVADDWASEIDHEEPPVAGWRCVQALLLAATAGSRESDGGPLHERLQRAWDLPRSATDALRRAMVLSADHELNASSFTARCVASTGATSRAAVGAALAALSGKRHGGMISDVEALWPTMQALDRQRVGEDERPFAQPVPLSGFGHRLYPDGDPRGLHLLSRLRPKQRLEGFVSAVWQQHGLGPTLDYGLVATCHAAGAPAGAAFALFAVARTIGWVAHIQEQQRTGTLIRPRAAYIGERPKPVEEERGRVFRRR